MHKRVSSDEKGVLIQMSPPSPKLVRDRNGPFMASHPLPNRKISFDQNKSEKQDSQP